MFIAEGHGPFPVHSIGVRDLVLGTGRLPPHKQGPLEHIISRPIRRVDTDEVIAQSWQLRSLVTVHHSPFTIHLVYLLPPVYYY
jgi:hypothetical protein